ncbi:hypothetical protein A0J61_09940 [Choanephora cucurbitarum]|uniref:Uncharacterized protein n=1 Tax=Choanephora cucurbitarum TaxID=101091 RepID=A0A1C7MYX9_9FUNG|nr:hypothetical protein A0J61_09940 [Choanephora cucurbitarum]
MQLSLSLVSAALLLAIVSAAPTSQSSSDVSASASASVSALDYASVIASMMEVSGSSVSAVPMEYFMTPQLEKRWTWDDGEDDDDKDYDSDDSKDGDYHDWDDEYHEDKHSDDKKDDHAYQIWHDEDLKKQKDDDLFDPFGRSGLFSPILSNGILSNVVPRPPPAAIQPTTDDSQIAPNGNQVTPNDNQSNGNQSNGNQSNGNQSNGNQSNGNQSNGNQSNGNQSNGNQSNGNQSTPNGDQTLSPGAPAVHIFRIPGGEAAEVATDNSRIALEQATKTVQVVGLFEPLGLNSSPIGPTPSSA